MKHALLATLALASCVCVSNSTLHRVLEAEGFTEVEATGLAPLSCSDSDTFRSGFKAKGRDGKPVEGSVCCGVFKNCTVRIE